MKLQLFGKKDSRNTPTVFTPWAIVHGLVGGVMYLWISLVTGIKDFWTLFFAVLILHTLYEIYDYYRTYELETAQNTFPNSIGDTIAAMFGFVLVFKFIPANIISSIILTLISIAVAEIL